MALKDLCKRWCDDESGSGAGEEPLPSRALELEQTLPSVDRRSGESTGPLYIDIVIQRSDTGETTLLLLDGANVNLGSMLEDPEIRQQLSLRPLIDAAKEKMLNLHYSPLNSGPSIALKDLISSFGCTPEALMMRLGIMLAKINRRTAKNPDYIPEDDEAEFIRSALFALKASGITEDDFCKAGKAKIVELKTVVAEYERRKGGPSWETF